MRTPSFRANVKLDPPYAGGGITLLQRGFEPQDADLKLGPFFLKLQAVQAAVLHSDNINLSPGNERKSGTIAIATATVGVVAQLTEGLRLATSGTFVYLPLEGKAGIAGFGLTDLYNFGLLAGPSTRAQLVWETMIGNWEVIFADDFRIGLGVYSDSVRNDFALFDGGYFDEESQAGRYVFSARGNRRDSRDSDDDRPRSRSDIVVFSNTISAATQRLLPGSIRLRARVYREDLWYNQGNRGLPSLREGVLLNLASERENMRFKPFARYEAFQSSRADAFQNIFRLGIAGPITSQLHFYGDAGWYSGGGRGSGYVWNLSLTHTAGPYTQHSLIYKRAFDDFHEEITEGVGYNLRQILGPKLSADAYLYDSRSEDSGLEEDESFDRHELRAGFRLTYQAGPKTALRLSGMYSDSDPDDIQTWTARLDIDYHFSETVLARFVYQHQRRTSSLLEENYSENLFFLSLAKYFD